MSLSAFLKNHARLLTIAGLVLFSIIVVLPPISYGYIYPNMGDDAAAHLQVFDRIKTGDPKSGEFILSYKIVGYPLIFLSEFTGLSLETLFLRFNFIALIGIGLSLYFVMSRLLNRKAGWLSLLVTLFCAQGIFFQFYYGQIFNAINMGIILPWLLLFTVRYLTEGKIHQLIFVVVLAGLFTTFHTSGIYLPFVAGLGTFVYALVKKFKVARRPFLLGLSLTAIPMVVFLLFVASSKVIVQYTLSNIGQGMAVPLDSYLMGIVSPSVLVLGGFLGVYFGEIKRNIGGKAKVVLFLLCSMAVVLAVASFGRLSLDPFRQALDFATVLALIVAISLSCLSFPLDKNKLASAVLTLAIVFGLWHNLSGWFNYNSVVTKVDKRAIEYVDTLGFKEYNTSPEVAFWIYDRYTKAKYSANATDVLIVRNVPMTPRSNPKNKWFDGHGIMATSNYTLGELFKDGKVSVAVFVKR